MDFEEIGEIGQIVSLITGSVPTGLEVITK